jgi:hypothetical protein
LAVAAAFLLEVDLKKWVAEVDEVHLKRLIIKSFMSFLVLKRLLLWMRLKSHLENLHLKFIQTEEEIKKNSKNCKMPMKFSLIKRNVTYTTNMVKRDSKKEEAEALMAWTTY